MASSPARTRPRTWNKTWKRCCDRVFDGANPTRVLASNVAGPLIAVALSELCSKRYGFRPEFLIPAPETCGVKNGYTDPARLGADRWAAVIGAFNRYGGPVCVLDAGTAITMDAVDESGQAPRRPHRPRSPDHASGTRRRHRLPT